MQLYTCDTYDIAHFIIIIKLLNFCEQVGIYTLGTAHIYVYVLTQMLCMIS